MAEIPLLTVVVAEGVRWLEISGECHGESWSARVPIAPGWTLVRVEDAPA